QQRVVAGTSDQDIVAISAVFGELNRRGGKQGGCDGIISCQGLDYQLVVGGFGAHDIDRSGQSSDVDTVCVAADRNDIVAVRAVDDDRVSRPIAPAAAGCSCQVQVDAGHAGAGQVIDGDGVGTAARREIDIFNSIDVHNDIGDVSGKPEATAVGRQVD